MDKNVKGQAGWSLWLKGIVLVSILCVSVILGISFGSVKIDWLTIVHDIWQVILSDGTESTSNTIIFDIRLPRVLLALFSGAILAMTGLLMQTVSQNYLADPYVLGVSSGASTGAVIAITSGLGSLLGAYSSYAIYGGAFLGAMVSTMLVIYLAGNSMSPIRLVLMGMGTSALFSALTMLSIYGAKDEAQVRSAMFWLMGSFSGTQWKIIPVACVACIVLMVLIWLYRHELDILLMGREQAEHLGVPVEGLQLGIVIVSSVTVAIVVSLAGIIGFIGLVIPHISRWLGDTKHGVMVWFTTLVGAIVMVWADIFSRTLFAPEELPIGILTALLGAPVFMWIISRKYSS